MDGLLIVDKPVGPTSHDVVAAVRRALGERRIGHTGTLDPGASGVLPLVIGRATRLARFLSGQDKTYRAQIRLGFATDTYDASGQPTAPPREGPWPGRDEIERALDRFRGTFLQQPPEYSAKKIGGKRSHRIARATSSGRSSTGAGAPPPARPDADPSPRISMSSARDGRRRSLPGPPALPALPAPAEVTVRRLELRQVHGDRVDLEIECSAGFYVRSLAHDLGAALGIGAHLAALQRTSSGALTLVDAVPLGVVVTDPARARQAVVPLSDMLTELRAGRLTAEGARRAVHGREVRPEDLVSGISETPGSPDGGGADVFVRLLDQDERLVCIASRKPGGLLHPLVVLM